MENSHGRERPAACSRCGPSHRAAGGLAPNHIRPLDPQNAVGIVKPAAADPRQTIDIDHRRVPRQVGKGRIPQRPGDPLSMPGLGCLHHPRGNGRIERQPLPLGDRDRPRVGTGNHDHRQADPVEAGNVGDAGDPHLREVRPDPGDRFGGRNAPVRVGRIELGRRMRHGSIQS